MSTVLEADGCDHIVNEGDNSASMMHKMFVLETAFATDGTPQGLESTTRPEFTCVFQSIKDHTPVGYGTHVSKKLVPMLLMM